MNFQEKVFEVAADLRARSKARAAVIQGSLATLRVSGRALDKVVRRHAARFVKENATIARAASADVSALARDTFGSFVKSGVKKHAVPTRKSASSRKRTRVRVTA